MSKTEKDILKNLQDKSNAFELPVEDFVWDNIEKEIAPKPSKKPFLNWKKGGLLLLLIAAIGLGVYFISGESQQLVKTQRIGELKHPTTKIDLGFVAKEKYAIVSILNDKGEDKRQLQSSLSGQMNSYFVQAPSMVSIQEINYPSYDLGLQNNQPEKLGNNKGTPTKINNKNKSGLNVYHNDTDLVMVNGQGGINLNDSGNIGNGISTTNSSSLIINENDTTSIKGGVFNSNIETVDNKGKQEDSIEVDLLNLNDRELERSGLNELDVVEDENNNEEVEDYHKKTERNFSLMGFAGLGQSFRTLNSEDQNTLITHKNEHEAFGNAYDFGIAAEFGIFKKSFLRAGLGYKFYSDKYDFQHGTLTHRTKNDYQYVQLPIYYGYNFIQRKKTKVSLLGGLKVNALFSAQSSWLDPEVFTPVAHSTNELETSPFRTFSTALTIGVDYNVAITPKLKLHIISSADAFLNSVYKRAVDISQKPYSLNMNVGLSYNF